MSRWRQFAIGVLLVMLALALFGPQLAPYSPADFSFGELLPPSPQHWLGTNSLGQDVLSGLLVGFRLTLSIALCAALLSVLIGSLAAAVATYFGGVIDQLLSGLTDVLLIVPELLVVLLFGAFAGPSVWNIILVMCLFSWSRIARLLRTRMQVALTQDDIQYTLLLRGGFWEIGRKLLPAVWPTVATLLVQQCSRAAVYEASLAYLGLGDASLKSWGRMIRMALDYEGIFWSGAYRWWLLPPIGCLLLFVFSLTLLVFDGKGQAGGMGS